MFDTDILICMKVAEVLVDETSSAKVLELRMKALATLRGQIEYYRKLGYVERLIEGIAEKRAAMIMTATTKTEMDKVMKPRAPRYDGGKFVPDEYNIPEEEMIAWSMVSLQAPLSSIGMQRYMELFREFFPEESKELKYGGAV
ncbi:MAG: hypothetical protein IJY39_09670 [Clostridia bacterium]|nr:hypothetical protein [Clostridia bacterium]